jgi:hypothetical protein
MYHWGFVSRTSSQLGNQRNYLAIMVHYATTVMDCYSCFWKFYQTFFFTVVPALSEPPEKNSDRSWPQKTVSSLDFIRRHTVTVGSSSDPPRKHLVQHAQQQLGPANPLIANSS